MKTIFIHGSGGCKEAWRYQVAAFDEAEAVNLPGHPEGELRTSIEAYVEWLKEYVETKNYTDLVLIGHSMGGAIALTYALTYPGELKGVITIGSGARLRVHPRFLQELEAAAQNPERYEAFLQTHELVDPELESVLKRRNLENGPEAALNDMRACDNFDVIERLGEITIPVLAICGSIDDMTPPKYSYFLAERIPRGEASIIEGGTHMVFAEQPEAVNNEIRRFTGAL
jgi:pimeloyl-ACP methyl ester carboxylesterase